MFFNSVSNYTNSETNNEIVQKVQATYFLWKEIWGSQVRILGTGIYL